MNRNVESHFSELPNVEIQRSIFDRSSTHKTSLNVGDLVPFYVDEVLPGDSFRITTSKVVRLQTLLTPVMDNMYLDTYFFFVPNRLVWNHWKEFCGENTESAWLPATEYQVPSISAPEGGFATGTIADYMGLPVGINWTAQAKNAPSALPFRSYALICNEFFRDENLTDPLNIPTGDANQSGSNGDSYINDVANGGKPFKVAKYHDVYTSMLPDPQKGPSVAFNLDTSGTVSAPMIYGKSIQSGQYFEAGRGIPVRTVPTADWLYKNNGTSYEIVNGSGDPLRMNRSSTSEGMLYYDVSKASSTNNSIYAVAEADSQLKLIPTNLYTPTDSLDFDIPVEFGFTINELRLAFQLQKFYERCARGGTRYIEFLKAQFGVTSPDARLQRPEYLGGNRIPIQIHEVTNSAQSEQDFLGDLGAMSVTSDIHEDLEHSFTEHGLIIGVCCLRYDHSYPQALEPFWSRKKLTDFFLPVFSSIGEQPWKKCTICATEENMDSDEVFGYQEAWADYRYKPNRVSGEMRPGIQNTLAQWHFADYYTEPPTLSDSWIREDKANVDRTLAVTSQVANQAFMDIYVQNICTRPMPMYSIPGLIDHH